MMTLDIVSLKQAQIEKASAVLANAFDNDPVFRYVAPKQEQSRANALKWICKTALKYSQPYNHIYTTTEDLKGVAAWIPPGHSSLNILQLLQAGLYALPFKLGWNKIGRCMSLLSEMDEFHERDMPHQHWYLFMLGVSPTYQGQGIGSLLLQPILDQADREKLPCYLETSTEQAVRFYHKNGFEVVRTHQLKEGNLQLWTMKREPQKTVILG
ncbi:MAG: GNAT family N-acetyltransferase [Coleofasciculus sp. S288]|nr:GNAT family N-acetyltransferase [Coleofasciculus sp. S288]